MSAEKEIKQLSDAGDNFIGVWLDENSERTEEKFYADLKQDLLNKLNEKIPIAKDKANYIKLVNDGIININRIKTDELKQLVS